MHAQTRVPHACMHGPSVTLPDSRPRIPVTPPDTEQVSKLALAMHTYMYIICISHHITPHNAVSGPGVPAPGVCACINGLYIPETVCMPCMHGWNYSRFCGYTLRGFLSFFSFFLPAACICMCGCVCGWMDGWMDWSAAQSRSITRRGSTNMPSRTEPGPRCGRGYTSHSSVRLRECVSECE